MWHSYRWFTDIDVCRFEDFGKEHKQWRSLEPSQIVSDEYNYYRRTSKRNGGTFVQRWPCVYGVKYYNSRFFERFKAERSWLFLGQLKLLFESGGCTSQ